MVHYLNETDKRRNLLKKNIIVSSNRVKSYQKKYLKFYLVHGAEKLKQ